MLNAFTQCEDIDVKLLFNQWFSLFLLGVAIVLKNPCRWPRYDLRVPKIEVYRCGGPPPHTARSPQHFIDMLHFTKHYNAFSNTW